MDPDVFSGALQVVWDAGHQIHVHNNGDAGMDVLVANHERAMRRNPRFDHPMTVVHFGFATPLTSSGRVARSSAPIPITHQSEQGT
jgi:predicted amidohydrolase YtcJ